jgi:hypothetical protein
MSNSPVYPAKAHVELNGSGAGSTVISLNGLLTTLNILRSSGSPVVTITDGIAKCLDAVTVAADGQYHPQAPIVTPANVDSGLKTFFQYSQAHDVTITVTSGDTTDGWVDVEFFMIA